jgi:flagellar biosynthetic protein FlhB
MAEETGQERTEEPTAKRIREAREKGQVPRSRELTTAMVMLTAAGSLYFLGADLGSGITSLLREGLTPDLTRITEPAYIVQSLGAQIGRALSILSPLFGILVVVAVLAPMALGGWMFSGKAMAFKLEKLNPLKGLRRIFSARGLVELLKALAKFVVVGGMAIVLLQDLVGDFIGLGRAPLQQGLAHAFQVFGGAFLALSATLILIAAVDVPFQLWDNKRKLRMTRQEVKDEFKETEGRPEVKSRIRSLQRELAQRRMMDEVPKADVVVTNPTHFAVALAYDQGGRDAPVVVAKGVDLIAFQIRRIASENGVEVVEQPLLARAVYYTTELDREIPESLYVAVAHVLAYVYHLRKARTEGAEEPDPLTDLPVPQDLAKPH